MIDNIGLGLLLVSCAISFGLGKTVVYFRNKKRQAIKLLAPTEN